MREEISHGPSSWIVWLESRRVRTMTDEEALAHKKNVCAAHRASATRLMNQADTLIAATPMEADDVALLQTTLSTKLKELTPEAQLEDKI